MRRGKAIFQGTFRNYLAGRQITPLRFLLTSLQHSNLWEIYSYKEIPSTSSMSWWFSWLEQGLRELDGSCLIQGSGKLGWDQCTCGRLGNIFAGRKFFLRFFTVVNCVHYTMHHFNHLSSAALSTRIFLCDLHLHPYPDHFHCHKLKYSTYQIITPYLPIVIPRKSSIQISIQVSTFNSLAI